MNLQVGLREVFPSKISESPTYIGLQHDLTPFVSKLLKSCIPRSFMRSVSDIVSAFESHEATSGAWMVVSNVRSSLA